MRAGQADRLNRKWAEISGAKSSKWLEKESVGGQSGRDRPHELGFILLSFLEKWLQLRREWKKRNTQEQRQGSQQVDRFVGGS